MTGQPGLFDLSEPPPAPIVRAPRDRGRRGEHWTRAVVADVHVVDRRVLRDAAHRRLSEGVTIDIGPTDDLDEDLLEPQEEIALSSAAAVRWWVEPTAGTWPQLADALRLDAVDLDATDLDATDESPSLVRVYWSVTVTITDLDFLRTQAADPRSPDETLPELWNRAADPFAPLTGLPGATWVPISVEVVRGG